MTTNPTKILLLLLGYLLKNKQLNVKKNPETFYDKISRFFRYNPFPARIDIEFQLAGFFLDPSKQCAAVRINWGAIIAPPQKWLYIPRDPIERYCCIETCQGWSAIDASSPPTIFPDKDLKINFKKPEKINNFRNSGFYFVSFNF